MPNLPARILRHILIVGTILSSGSAMAGSSTVLHVVVAYDRMAISEEDGLAVGRVVMDPTTPLCTMRRKEPKRPCNVQLLPLYSRKEIGEAIRLLDLIPKPRKGSCRAARYSKGLTITWRPAKGTGRRILRVDSPCLADRPGVRRIQALSKRAIRIARDLCS